VPHVHPRRLVAFFIASTVAVTALLVACTGDDAEVTPGTSVPVDAATSDQGTDGSAATLDASQSDTSPDVDAQVALLDPGATVGARLIAWLDPDDPSKSATADGTDVTTWPSRGTGFDFTPCLTSPAPKLRRSLLKLKGRAGFDFTVTNGIGQRACLEASAAFPTALSGAADLAVFVVAHYVSAGNSDGSLFTIKTLQGGGQLSAFSTRPQSLGFTALQGMQVETTVGPDDISRLYVVWRHAGNLELRIDGVMKASTPAGTGSLFDTPVGALLDVGANLPGKIGAFVAVRAPTSAEVQGIEAYLRDRYLP
jgi:hypothetical protein